MITFGVWGLAFRFSDAFLIFSFQHVFVDNEHMRFSFSQWQGSSDGEAGVKVLVMSQPQTLLSAARTGTARSNMLLL
jgi:hypothetical protein